MPPKTLANHIANKLARGILPKDLVLEVVEATGMDWGAAEKYIDEISHYRRESIAKQRLPRNLLIAGCTFLIGAAILTYTILRLQESIAEAFAGFGDALTMVDTLTNIYRHFPSLGLMLTGLLMVVGGIIGSSRAIVEFLQDVQD